MNHMSAAHRLYLKWIRDEGEGSYGAWKPSTQRIDPGDIGYFNKDNYFSHKSDQNLGKFGVEDVEFSGELTVNPSAEGSERDFTIAVDGGAAVPFAAHAVTVNAGARITLRAKRSTACILQLRQVTRKSIINPTEVAEQIRGKLIESLWRPDLCVITERIECKDGFAGISSHVGHEYSFEAKSEVSLGEIADLVHVSLAPSSESSRGSSHDFPFTDCEVPATPLFVPGICVRRKWWAKLVVLRTPSRHGKFLIDESGRPWFDGQPPANLRHLTDAQAVYQEGAPGVLTRDQLENMPIHELIGPYEPPPEVRISSENARAALYLPGYWARQLQKAGSQKTSASSQEEAPAP